MPNYRLHSNLGYKDMGWDHWNRHIARIEVAYGISHRHCDSTAQRRQRGGRLELHSPGLGPCRTVGQAHRWAERSKYQFPCFGYTKNLSPNFSYHWLPSSSRAFPNTLGCVALSLSRWRTLGLAHTGDVLVQAQDCHYSSHTLPNLFSNHRPDMIEWQKWPEEQNTSSRSWIFGHFECK